MKTILLKGEPRTDLGTTASKHLRKEGKVPCVLYGDGSSVNFSVYADDFRNLIYTPNTYTVKIEVGNDSYKAILQDVQFHPVNDDLRHVDFLAVSDDKPVVLDLPVKVTGNSPGVRSGGKLMVKMKKLRVRGLIKNLPDYIEANIDHLELGKSVKVGEITVPNIELLDSPNNAILSVEATRATREAAKEAAGEAAKGKK